MALRVGPAGPSQVGVDAARQRSDVLPAATGAAIAAGVRALEVAAGAPLDVEWAVAGGRLSFLQARPQPRPAAPPLAAAQTWTRANVRETTPELPSAISRSFFVQALDRGARLNTRGAGVADDPTVAYAAAVHGRIVLNERIFLDHGAALGAGEAFRAWAVSLAGGTGGANEIPAVDLWTALRHPVIVARALAWAGGAERNALRYLAWLAARRAERARLAPREGAEPAVLIARLQANPFLGDSDRWIVAQSRLAVAVANGNMLAGSILRRLNAPALIPRLLEGDEPSVSTRQIDDLVALALAFRSWSGAAAFLTAPPAGADAWRSALPAQLAGAVDGWLADYGHRGPFESDLSSPRYRDDRRLVGAALLPLVAAAAPPEGPAERRLRRVRDREAAWAEVTAAVPRLLRMRLRGVLRGLARAMALRERFRSELMIDCAEVRDGLRELGRRWAASARVQSADDVFHLELPELERAVEDARFEVGVAVRRELARRAAWRRVELPNRFTTEELDGLVSRGLGGLAAAGALTGTAVSPGVVEAPACVLRTPEEGVRMPPGAVLVAPVTDPGWTPLFAQASAVVVELGGLFSHAATVAREYGLPAVSNVEGATDRLRDGDVIRVDGFRGVVEVVSPAARPGR